MSHHESEVNTLTKILRLRSLVKAVAAAGLLAITVRDKPIVASLQTSGQNLRIARASQST